MNSSWRASLVVATTLLSAGSVRSASGQWGISLEANRSAYGGTSKDTSQGPQGSLRPSGTQALTLRFSRRLGRFTAALGARLARSDIVVDASGLSASLSDEFKSIEVLPEVSWRVIRTSPGATLELYGGPVLGVWTFEDFGGRFVPGATAGFHGLFPIADRLKLSVRVGASLMRSVFRDGELPPEVVIRSMRRSEVALGLRYGP